MTGVADPLRLLRAPVRDDATGTSAADLAVSPAPLPDQPGRAVPEGLDERRAAPHPATPHDAARARLDGELRPASWDDALDVVADGIVRTQAAYGT